MLKFSPLANSINFENPFPEVLGQEEEQDGGFWLGSNSQTSPQLCHGVGRLLISFAF